MADINLIQDKNGIFVWKINNGKVELTKSLKTAVYMSIFCKKRAEAELVANPFYREGDPVNEFYKQEIGSLFWYYAKQKNTQQNAQAMESALLEGLQWLIDDNLASDIEITTSREQNKLNINIQLTNTQTGLKENYDFFNIV